jgi:hypothetical protein
MSKLFHSAKRLLRKLFFYLPSALPRGMSEFEGWAKDIIDTYQLPDNDSVRFALATMILHSGQTEAFKPKRYFALTALKGMSSQVAHGAMQELKEKQARLIAEEQKSKAEATASQAPPAVASYGSEQLRV